MFLNCMKLIQAAPDFGAGCFGIGRAFPASRAPCTGGQQQRDERADDGDYTTVDDGKWLSVVFMIADAPDTLNRQNARRKISAGSREQKRLPRRD